MTKSSLLEVEGLHVFQEGSRAALVNGVDLSVDIGESIGIVGESGSGKTLCVQALMNILPVGLRAECRTLRYKGKTLALGSPEHKKLIGRDLTLVFQDPFASLNPCYTIGFQIVEVLQAHCGLEEGKAEQEACELLKRVRIPEPELRFKAYPHQLSGGMIQRVMIAISLAVSPQLLIADEPTTALDVTIQAQILNLLRQLTREQGMALAMISHNLAVFPSMSDRLYVFYAGEVVEHRETQAIIRTPQHPYTSALMDSIPEYAQARRLKTIPGFVPDPQARPDGCIFNPRCAYCQEKCKHHKPPLEKGVRCFFPLATRAANEGKHEEASVRNTSDEVMRAEHLHQIYTIGSWRKRKVHAVFDVSFSLKRGQTLGIVGESGSGKSTLGRMITLIEKPAKGRLLFSEKGGLAKGAIQAIFQDPFASLNPRRKIGKQIEDPLKHFTDWDVAKRRLTIETMLAEIGLDPSHIHAYPHMFSGGQRQRIALLRAIIYPPQILIADEPVSALDISVQAQILNLLNDMQERLNFAMVLISHDLAVVRHCVDEVMVLYLGQVMEQGKPAEIFSAPRHPYTRALLDSSPRLLAKDHELKTIEGEMASPINRPSGCVYHQRCPFAQARCAQEPPQLEGNQRLVRCWRADELELSVEQSA